MTTPSDDELLEQLGNVIEQAESDDERQVIEKALDRVKEEND